MVVLRQGVALIRRLVPPTDGFSGVGGYAVAIFVRFAEMQLGRRIALVRGSPIPLDRCGLASGNTDAGLIRDGEVQFCGYVTLIGCASPPSDGLRHVRSDPVAAGVLPAESELGRRVAPFRRLTLGRRCGIIGQRGVFSRRRERRTSHVVERRGARAARTKDAGYHKREDHGALPSPAC